jgi:hypothetical protein
MHSSQPASLLVAALAMLRHPCARNRASAQLLLERAAGHAELSPAERETCLALAEDLDAFSPAPARGSSHGGIGTSRHINSAPWTVHDAASAPPFASVPEAA